MPAPTLARRFSLGRPLLLEMLRFGLMGATSAGIYLVFFMPMRWAFPIRLWVAATIAYLLSMVVNYLLQRNFTFRSKRPHQEAVARFLVVQLLALGLNAVMLELLTTRAKLSLWLAQGIAIVGVAVWSYVAQKVWVFFGKHVHADPAGRIAES
jgi:putative flippase GtrA